MYLIFVSEDLTHSTYEFISVDSCNGHLKWIHPIAGAKASIVSTAVSGRELPHLTKYGSFIKKKRSHYSVPSTTYNEKESQAPKWLCRHESKLVYFT
jgi:hypothetical protein